MYQGITLGITKNTKEFGCLDCERCTTTLNIFAVLLFLIDILGMFVNLFIFPGCITFAFSAQRYEGRVLI